MLSNKFMARLFWRVCSLPRSGLNRKKKFARRFSSSGANDVLGTIWNAAGAAKHRGLGGAAAHDCVVCLVAVDFEIKGPDIRASACATRAARGGGSRSRPRWPGFGG